jgi:hypothetical protein
VHIGVPYGTSYWQVGDSSEQNGSYKIAMTKSKQELVLKKQRMCLVNARVETYKITVVLNTAWDKSFSRASYNKEAIAVREWGPLTQNLMENYELLATATDKDLLIQHQQESAAQTDPPSLASTLNFSDGLSNTLIVDILQNIEGEAVRDQIQRNQEEGSRAIEQSTNCEKLTTGQVFKAGKAVLGPDVLSVAISKKREWERIEKEKHDRLAQASNKKREAYNKAHDAIS